MVNKNTAMFLVSFLALFFHVVCVYSIVLFVPKMRQTECWNRLFRGSNHWKWHFLGNYLILKPSVSEVLERDRSKLFQV